MAVNGKYTGNGNDTDNARYFIKYYGDDIRYCTERKEYAVWDKTKWIFGDGKAMIIADVAINEIADCLLKKGRVMENKSMERQAIALGNVKFRNSMLEKARPYLEISISDFDSYPYLFNVKNGVIDFSNNGKLIPHEKSKKFYLTKMAGVSYNKSAKCPKWIKDRLQQLSNNDDLMDYLQRASGYIATGYASEKCVIFVLGPTNTGKSVYSLTLIKILGDYAVTVPASTLMSMKFENQLTPHLSRLPGKRLAAISETKITAAFDEELLKSITGGESIGINPKYGIPYEFKPECKFLIVANDKPRVLDMTDSFWNRMHLIEIYNTIPVDKQRPIDEVVNEYLYEEGSGILNWLIEGELKRQKQRLNVNMPKAMIEARERYRIGEDIIGGFFNLYYVQALGELEKATDIISKCNIYLESLGHRKISSKKVSECLRSRGIIRGGNGNMFYLGIRGLTIQEKEERGLPVTNEEREMDETVENLFRSK